MAEIGSIRATRREIVPAEPRIPASAFGAGIGSALTGISQTLRIKETLAQEHSEAQTTLDLAYKARQDRVTKANLQVGFLNMQNDVTMQVAEMGRTAMPGAPDFTNQAGLLIDKRYAEFLETVPEDMRPEFLPKMAESKIGILNNAFAFQVGSENENYKYGVDKFVSGALNQILLGTVTSMDQVDAVAGKMLGQLDDLFKTTPLSAAEARALKDTYIVQLKSAQLARLAQMEAEGLGSAGGMVEGPGNIPMPAGISGPAAAFLGYVVQKESGGEFNVMYSPDGRRYFSDYSQHPNQPAEIKDGPHKGELSSAAGGPQFLKSTWDDLAKRYGFTDFSPENQMRGAWMLAQEAYRNATGKSLEDALNSGSMMVIGQARRILAGQWEALGKVTDKEFFEAVTGTAGTASSLIDDPEFSMIPYDTRAKIVTDATARAQAIQTQISEENKKKQTAAFNELLIGLRFGNKGVSDVQAFQSQFLMTYEDTVKTQEAYKQGNEQRYDAQQFQGKISNPGFVVDSEEDKRQANAFLTQTGGIAALQNGDVAFVETALLPLVKQGGYMPSNMVTQLTNQMTSKDANTASFALDTMAKLQDAAPSEFHRAFNDDVEMATALYATTKANIGQEDVLSYIRGQFDPANEALRTVREKQIGENMKTFAEDFTPEGIAHEMGFSAPTMLAGEAMFAEFLPTYTYMFSRSGDHKTAMAAATKLLSARWGETNTGTGTQVMRYPPEKTAKPYEGSFSYVDPQLRAHFGLAPTDRYELVSDGQTEREFLSGKPASYRVVKLDENGMIEKLLEWQDTVEYDGRQDSRLAGRPARFSPSITADMTQAQIDRVLVKGEEKELMWRLWNYETSIHGTSYETYPGGEEGYRKDRARYAQLRGYGTDDKVASSEYYKELSRLLGDVSRPKGSSVPPASVIEFMQKLAKFTPDSPTKSRQMLKEAEKALMPFSADPKAQAALTEIKKQLEELK